MNWVIQDLLVEHGDHLAVAVIGAGGWLAWLMEWNLRSLDRTRRADQQRELAARVPAAARRRPLNDEEIRRWTPAAPEWIGEPDPVWPNPVATSTWVDITARVLSAELSSGREDEGSDASEWVEIR